MRILLLLSAFAFTALLWATIAIVTHVRRARRRRLREQAEMPAALPVASHRLITPDPVSMRPAAVQAPPDVPAAAVPLVSAPLPLSVLPAAYAALPGMDTASLPSGAAEPMQSPGPTLRAEEPIYTSPAASMVLAALVEPAAPMLTAQAVDGVDDASAALPETIRLPPEPIEPAPSERAAEMSVDAPTPLTFHEPVFDSWTADDLRRASFRVEQPQSEAPMETAVALPARTEAEPPQVEALAEAAAATSATAASALEVQPLEDPLPAQRKPPVAETRGFPQPRVSSRHPLSMLARKQVERADWAYFNKDFGDLTDPYESRRPTAVPLPALPKDRRAS